MGGVRKFLQWIKDRPVIWADLKCNEVRAAHKAETRMRDEDPDEG